MAVNFKYFHQSHFKSTTSSATSGPLLTKSPCLVTETRVLMSPVTVTASSLSVFRNMMYGIQSILIFKQIELFTLFTVLCVSIYTLSRVKTSFWRKISTS